MNVLLLHLDGKLPNVALMRLAAHHRALGDNVVLRKAGNAEHVEPRLDDPPWGRVYASAIFESTRPVAERVREVYPGAIVGGTGWDVASNLEAVGVATTDQDYSVYPRWRQSIGFSQRGCRLRCEFCVVPLKEGAVTEDRAISEIWRGDPWPREVVLLDNDFFGQPRWRDRIDEMRAGRFRVCFSQGINARMLNDETAAAIASVDYRGMPTVGRRPGDTVLRLRERRIYTAWDNRRDERVLFRGLEALVRHGVAPRHIMVYMLVGYWPGETHTDRDYRRRRLREFGALPYPMPFKRTEELLGFQRWVIGGFDKSVSWEVWSKARWQPRNLGLRRSAQLEIFDAEGVS